MRHRHVVNCAVLASVLQLAGCTPQGPGSPNGAASDSDEVATGRPSSTADVQVVNGVEMQIPASYSSPTGKFERALPRTVRAVNFVMFHPTYGGYPASAPAEMTAARLPLTWPMVPPSLRRQAIWVNEAVPLGQDARPVSPGNWWDFMFEPRPGFGVVAEFGELKCYGQMASDRSAWHCRGPSSTGEEIYLDCDGDAKENWPMGVCQVRSALLSRQWAVYYLYNRALISHWREIDDEVYNKLNSWTR